MTEIRVATRIQAPQERCFDLARSIHMHVASTSDTGEKAVAGVTSGLINLGQSKTWEATHFGVRQRLTSVITAFDRPRFFEDEMTEGAFASFVHDHLFEFADGVTTMMDVVRFAAPMGPLGSISERLLLAGYLERFITKRGAAVKQVAESDAWKQYLPENEKAAG